MAGEELDSAVQAGKNELKFDHFLLLSRVYKMDMGGEDELGEDVDMDGGPKKKSKTDKKIGTTQGGKDGLWHYHPEEDFLEKVSYFVTKEPVVK